MIRLFDITGDKIIKGSQVLVDENSIFFAHFMGFILSLSCLLLVIFVNNTAIWYVVLGFSILKTVSAFGFCPASKLYDCTINGTCCVKKHNHGTNSSCK